ncbi:MAG: methionyl-tRNA formyltransferase [Spirochaetes bacterium]|nr:methionyl-tRNA formyltransferase [Spirochaetota bacterium]
MKAGFFGTPEISAYYLERLSEFHDIIFAVTAEDKPKGRHKTPSPGEVKVLAVKNNIPVLQPEKLSDKEFVKEISTFSADIYVVVAYGKLIPSEIFNIPRYKTVNVHPSLLPKYRGAAPMQWALINGEEETGITIQYINEGMDTGDILGQTKITLNQEMTCEDLYNTVLPLGANLLLDVLGKLPNNGITPLKQDDSQATYCGKIDQNTAHIDWNNDALKIHNLVRGLNPKPVAWSTFREKKIKIYKTGINENLESSDLAPGNIAVQQKRLIAGTGKGILEILELQPEGKKIMHAGSFINGYRIDDGDYFK